MFDTSKIGHTFPSFPVAVEFSKIRELSLAIGDNNPIYHDQPTAQQFGYKNIPLLPTTATIFLFRENTHFVEQLAELGLDFSRLLHREEEYEYLAPIYPGQNLTGTMTV